MSINGAAVDTLSLSPASLPSTLALPPGPGWAERFTLQGPDLGVLAVTVDARSAGGSAVPFSFSLPIVKRMPPTVLAPILATTTVPAGRRASVAVTARVFDDCPVRRVNVMADLGRGFRRAGALRDTGRNGDAIAGDGVFSGTIRLKPTRPGSFPVRVTARNKAKLSASGPTVPLAVQ